MADDKKQQNDANTQAAHAPVKSAAGDEKNGSKAGKTRMIYRHHRKFMGGGLVGLILFAFLVGTETLTLYKQQADGAAAQGQNQTAIKVLERQHNKANTQKSDGEKPANAHNTKKNNEKSVVARNGDTHQAQITIHKDVPKPEGEQQQRLYLKNVENAKVGGGEPFNVLRKQMKNLHKITHGQQQMIRMLSHKQNEHKDDFTEKLNNLSLQLSKTTKADQPTLQKINKNLTLLQLRQDVLFFYNQWQQGLLTADTLRQWQEFVNNKGFNKVARFTSALRQSLEKHGLLNEQTLRQTAREMHTGMLAARQASTKSQSPQAKKQMGQQMSQGQINPNEANKSWWQKLKDRLSGLVRIKRLENDTKAPQASVNGQQQAQKDGTHNNTLQRENVIRALARGDMKSFRGFVQNNDQNDNSLDPVVEKLRMLVNVQVLQKDIFQQLYRTLTAAQKRGE